MTNDWRFYKLLFRAAASASAGSKNNWAKEINKAVLYTELFHACRALSPSVFPYISSFSSALPRAFSPSVFNFCILPLYPFLSLSQCPPISLSQLQTLHT